MTLSSLITLISRQFPGWSRPAVKDFISDVQGIIFSVPLGYMRVTDSKYGTDYQLSTTAGQLKYTLDAVSDPHGDSSVTYPAIMFTGGVTNSPSIYPSTYSMSTNNTGPSVIVSQGDDSKSATILFADDPGSTVYGLNCSYYVKAYKRPTELLSEATALDLPSSYHIDLATGVGAMLEKMSNNSRNEWKEWVAVTLPQIRYGLNNESHTFTTVTGGGY